MVEAAPSVATPLVVGRYALFDELAAGGMATVHLGRLLGPVGFSRTVAVKRLHTHFTNDEEFVTMFMDEARIVARIVHPNVVQMVDVVQSDKGLFLVMDYVHGESLSRLLRVARSSGTAIPPKIAASVLHGVLLGLHAAHETKGVHGEQLNVVHRDVSPQNIMVGVDGSARVLDFGIAKAAGRAQVTREGQIKGKLAYMAPEQIRGNVDRRADVFATSVVLWEMLAGARLHEGMKDVDIVTRIARGEFESPRTRVPSLAPELDAIVMKGLSPDPLKRFTSAREMALELEKTMGLVAPSEISEWVESLAKDSLDKRAGVVAAMERASSTLTPADDRSSLIPPPDQTIGELVGDMTSSVVDVQRTPPGTEVPIDLTATAPRSFTPLFLLFAFMAVCGIGLASVALSHRVSAGRDPDPSASAPVASASSSEAPAPIASFDRPSPASAASSSATPPSSASAVPSASSGSRSHPIVPASGAAPSPMVRPPAASPGNPAPVTTTPRPNASAQAAPSAAPAPKCDPPFTIDASGHRHYKLECMAP